MFGSNATTPRSYVEPKSFAPKMPVLLNPPKEDPISFDELSKCDGMSRDDTIKSVCWSEPLISDMFQERIRLNRCSSQSRAPSSMFHEMVHINQEDVITVR